MSVTKAIAQRLENWKAVLGQYRYAIEHIPGERNCWGDLLSRWVKVPSVPVRSVAVHSPCDADDSLPSADVIRAAQRMVWFCVAVENDLFERHDRNQQRVCVGASKTT